MPGCMCCRCTQLLAFYATFPTLSLRRAALFMCVCVFMPSLCELFPNSFSHPRRGTTKGIPNFIPSAVLHRVFPQILLSLTVGGNTCQRACLFRKGASSSSVALWNVTILYQVYLRKHGFRPALKAFSLSCLCQVKICLYYLSEYENYQQQYKKWRWQVSI